MILPYSQLKPAALGIPLRMPWLLQSLATGAILLVELAAKPISAIMLLFPSVYAHTHTQLSTSSLGWEEVRAS